MNAMDFGIPDLSPGRDTAPDAPRRHGKSDQPSDFAALLDRAADEPDDHARRPEADGKRAVANDVDRPREKAPRTERADDNDRIKHDDQPADTAQTAQSTAPAQQPASEPQQQSAQDGADTPQASAQPGEPDAGDDGAASTPAQAAAVAAASAAAGTPAPPANPGALVNPTRAADAMPGAADRATPPASVAAGSEVVHPAAQTAASQDQQASSTAAPSSFPEHLAVATGEATDASVPKAARSEVTDTTPKPQTPDSVVIVPEARPAAPVMGSNPQPDAPQGNSAQPAPTPPQGPAAPVAVAQTPPDASTQGATAEKPESGDAALLAVLRAANAQPQASARPAENKLPDASAPVDTMLKGVAIETKPAVEPAKSETPSKPFGALAPGLGIAAQVTSQQTPEQATAAERLAQLAAAVGEQTEETADTAETQKPVDIAAAPAKHEQPAQAAEIPTHRQSVTDIASSNAAARAARPNFHPVVTQVAAQMAQAAADGTDRINIRLSPAELGRIDVKLDFGPDGRVQAVFAAERPQTMELLQRDARDLERALQDAGLRADSGSLSFNLRGQGRDGQGEQTANGGGQDHAPTELAASQLQAYAAGSGGAGRLDIRI